MKRGDFGVVPFVVGEVKMIGQRLLFSGEPAEFHCNTLIHVIINNNNTLKDYNSQRYPTVILLEIREIMRYDGLFIMDINSFLD